MADYFDLAVIGAGAAGLSAAAAAAGKGLRVLLLEKADRPGRKILASGNGRCNLMNVGELRYPGNPEFAAAVLSGFGPKELREFFYGCGLILREEEDGRVYPVTNASASVLSALRSCEERNGCMMKMNHPVRRILRENSRFSIFAGETSFSAGKILVACGGAAQPKLGGTADGYRLLEGLGHRLVPVRAALVPVAADRRSISGLSGIRARCTIVLKNRESKEICREKGEILFTDYGVSGICVMQCSGRIRSREDFFEVDFISHVFSAEPEAAKEIEDRMTRFADRESIALLEGILVPKLAFAVLKQAGLPMRGETIRELPENTAERVLSAATRYRISNLCPRGLDQAQVTGGGIRCEEFDPHTMESRLIPGLYAAGEVLDVDGDCGGYNLMFAFASGITAAMHAAGEGK